eukprot:1142933_1
MHFTLFHIGKWSTQIRGQTYACKRYMDHTYWKCMVMENRRNSKHDQMSPQEKRKSDEILRDTRIYEMLRQRNEMMSYHMTTCTCMNFLTFCCANCVPLHLLI